MCGREKKILLTGATGFLGSHLLRRLIQENHRIVILKRSFSNISKISDIVGKHNVESYDIDRIKLEKIFDEHKVDVILHCATNYGRKDINPLEIIDANLMLPLRLLLFGMAHHVGSFINTDTILDKRISHYSLSKKHFLDWLKAYKDKIRCINVALEHFYGFGDDKTKFVTRIIQDLVDGVQEIKLTKGEQERDFIYIDDVTEAFSCILGTIEDMNRDFTEFQVGTGRNVSIRELCETIKKLADNTKTYLNFGAVPYRENENMESTVDLSRLNALGWTPKTDLEKGLAIVIEKETKKNQ